MNELTENQLIAIEAEKMKYVECDWCEEKFLYESKDKRELEVDGCEELIFCNFGCEWKWEENESASEDISSYINGDED